MTQFKNIEILCEQYFNLTAELKSMIEKEEYKEALEKLDSRNNIVKKFFLAQKTVSLTAAEEEKLRDIETKIREDEDKTIKSLQKLKNEVGEELNSTKKKFKVNSAYSKYNEKNTGTFINITE